MNICKVQDKQKLGETMFTSKLDFVFELVVVHRSFPIPYPGDALRHRRALKEGSTQFLLRLVCYLSEFSTSILVGWFVCLFVCLFVSALAATVLRQSS